MNTLTLPENFLRRDRDRPFGGTRDGVKESRLWKNDGVQNPNVDGLTNHPIKQKILIYLVRQCGLSLKNQSFGIGKHIILPPCLPPTPT